MISSLLPINNLKEIYKIVIIFRNGSHCSRFSDGNHVNVGLNTIDVIIFGTIHICAHLQIGISSGTFAILITINTIVTNIITKNNHQ
jgi:hypothetical protein